MVERRAREERPVVVRGVKGEGKAERERGEIDGGPKSPCSYDKPVRVHHDTRQAVFLHTGACTC